MASLKSSASNSIVKFCEQILHLIVDIMEIDGSVSVIVEMNRVTGSLLRGEKIGERPNPENLAGHVIFQICYIKLATIKAL